MEPVAVRAPRSNPDLVAHEASEKALREGYLSNRLHHAWLFTGARGIGKATLAYRFARFLLPLDHARKPPKIDPRGSALKPQ